MVKKFKARLISGGIAFLLGTVILTGVVGNYFVNYALVPQYGGQERKVKDPKQENEGLARRKKEEKEARDRWLTAVKEQTEEVNISSKEGLRLAGHAYRQTSPTHDWMIVVHGYQSSEEESQILAQHFYQAGYHVLTYSQRGCGKSEGDYIGMGLLEKEDLKRWTQWVIDQDADSRVIYHGTSMGGATVLLASGEQLPDQVKAIVSDCSYTSIWAIFASELKARFSLPSFPVLDMARAVGRFRAGYDIKDGDVEQAVSQSQLPIFFLHTKEDTFVPVEMVQSLYQAKTGGQKDLFIYETGKHAEAKYHPDYYEKIQSFIEKYQAK